MRPKRVHVVAIVLIILLAALPLLAVLQYQWLGHVQRAERTRLEQAARRAALQFAADLAGEFSVVRSLFSIGHEEIDNEDWTGLTRRYQFWLDNTRFPGLVDGIYLSDADGEQFREFGISDGFSQATMSLDEVLGGQSASYLLPAQRFGKTLLVLRVDKVYLRQEVVPFLAAEHFGSGSAHRDFALQIRDHEEVIYQSDNYPTEAKPLHVVGRFDGFRDVTSPPITALRGRLSAAEGDNTASLSVSGIAAEDLPPGVDTPAVREWITTARPAEENLNAAVGGLSIRVTHVAGSLEAAVSQTQTRNLALSFGILAVLGAGLLVLFFLYRRAETLARREREFLASVTHELRTPIAALYSAGENLEAGVVVDHPSVRSYGSLIKKQGARLRGMIDRVLGYATLVATPGRQRAPAACEPVNLNALVERIVDAHRHEADAKHIDLSVYGTTRALPVDASAVEIIVNNLVGNSLRHARGATVVLVAIGESVFGATISVEDDGPGIDQRELRSVFEPFYRGRRSVADQVPGTGVGLSLVKRVVEYHGGTVAYNPGEKGGARFVVTLPVGDAPNAPNSSDANSDSVGNPGAETATDRDEVIGPSYAPPQGDKQ